MAFNEPFSHLNFTDMHDGMELSIWPCCTSTKCQCSPEDANEAHTNSARHSSFTMLVDKDHQLTERSPKSMLAEKINITVHVPKCR